MKYYGLVSRVLIALLFVVAGVMKVMGFAGQVSYIGGLGVPLPVVATLLVILVEIPVAMAFAWGYKTCVTGWILIGFTALTILLVHRDFSSVQNMIMALKNLAIIGGILSVISTCGCDCGKCEDCKVKNS